MPHAGGPQRARRGRTQPEHNAERLIMREKTVRRVTDAKHQDTPPLPLKQCARRNGRWQCHRPAPAPGFLRNMPTGSGRERTARTGPVTRSSPKATQTLQAKPGASAAALAPSSTSDRHIQRTKAAGRHAHETEFECEKHGPNPRARATHNIFS